MSKTVRDICNVLEKYAPLELAESWDNVGLLIGREEKTVNKVMLALDATPLVIKEAIENNIDMIITHHPIPFKPIKRINSSSVLGNQLLDLIENKIALYAAHTNLDAAKGGTADTIAQKLDLEEICVLDKPSCENYYEFGIGRIGYLKKSTTLQNFAEEVKSKLNLSTIQYLGHPFSKVKKVALCTGSAIDLVNMAVKMKADVFLTGDIKYHEGLDAISEDIGLVNASHYGTEAPILPVLKGYLEETIKGIEFIISKNQYDPFITI